MILFQPFSRLMLRFAVSPEGAVSAAVDLRPGLAGGQRLALTLTVYYQKMNARF
jgi:hypothetical protein